ncbi:MAG: two-component sensor histidine kinase [Anaerolineae bacterium]|nr:MAG: two-component sensor histidine kinase [Anaerolineae bacterium]
MKSIQAKLLLSYLLVLLVGVVVLLAAVQLSAPTAYSRHMMADMPGMGPGHGMGPGGSGLANFRAGLLEALGYAIGAALLAALAVSILFSQRIVSPLEKMAAATKRIAEGHYDERVHIQGQDELAQLAHRFNQMAEQLENTEAMRRRLIGDVSHELRTPLTAIQGYTEGMIDGVLPADTETLQQIHHETRRLTRLVDDLQELSQVESGAFSLELHPQSLAALVQTTAKRLAPAYEKKGVSLQFNLPANLPLVLADEDRVIQILTNLLNNALAYTPSGGKVTVTATPSGHEVQIAVQDTGIGIPAESIARIFDRFYRVDKSRSRSAGGGSGIGLTIARALVEAHGGRIWAQSAGEGQGSTFTFTLRSIHA